MNIENWALRATLPAFIVALAAAGCGPHGGGNDGSPAKRATAFENGAGTRLSASLYPASGPGRPGVVLVHDVGSTGAAWGGFPERLQRRGYACLVLDLAGHGASTDGGTIDFRTFSDADWRARTDDIRAACAALVQAGCDPENVGVIGAGLGADLALAQCASDDLATVVLISPDLETRGLDAVDLIQRVIEVPVLILASEGDAAAAQAGNQLKKTAPGFCEYRVYPGNLHGTDLLAGSESAALQIFQWLEETLPIQPSD